jgi:hypothetical protein
MPNIVHRPNRTYSNRQVSAGQSDRPQLNLKELSFNELRTLAAKHGINTHYKTKIEIISLLSKDL